MAPDEQLEVEDELEEVADQGHLLHAAASGLTIVEPDPEEEDDEGFEDEPRTVLITGACGNLGTKLRVAWADLYDLVLLDAAAPPHDPEVIKVDLSELDDDWITYFHGVDTVVHLAGNPDEFATWEELEAAEPRRAGQRAPRRGAGGRRTVHLRQLEPRHGGLPRARHADHARPAAAPGQPLRRDQADGRAPRPEHGPRLRYDLHLAAARLGPAGCQPPRHPPR